MKNNYPFPFITDLFDQISGAEFFSKLDLLSGHISVQPILTLIERALYWPNMGEDVDGCTHTSLCFSKTRLSELCMRDCLILAMYHKDNGSVSRLISSRRCRRWAT